jgi:Protein of unknown function (DUF3810)
VSARVLRALQLVSILVAVALAIAPLPPALVERYYSDGFYPRLQAHVTSWSNETPVAIFDFILAILIGALGALLWRGTSRALRQRSFIVWLRGLAAIATLLAITYIWFQASWGLNYARQPLEASIGYDRSRVTATAVRALAERAVTETNNAYASGHSSGFPEVHDVPPALVRAFHAIEQRLGRTRPTVPGRPKYTVLAPLFRIDGTDGMNAPFMLETLLNPDLTPAERPAVLAHEWAHLAGYAPEDDASFVGMLAALGADPGARYSAWMTLTWETVGQVPRDDRKRLLSMLQDGPRRDQQAIAARLASRIELIERASWATYDRYLKAQGVPEGIRSYSRVVELLIGSGALDW